MPNFTPFDPNLARLIADLPQASSLDLYRIEVAIRKLRDEPQRIIDVRRHLHLGMAVHFMNDRDATMHSGRIVAMRDRDVTIDDSAQHTRWSGVPYAAIDLLAKDSDVTDVEILDTPKGPPPRQRRPTRDDFKVGDTVSFVDRAAQPRIGKVVRLNMKTASIDCGSGQWRVSFALLQHVVDV
ncbi:MAG TPA: hypothetical protein VMU33_08245 [Burkholderiaceae bacterium]|nr:hypothetical protein [Burkholderiaceae bacterium]